MLSQEGSRFPFSPTFALQRSRPSLEYSAGDLVFLSLVALSLSLSEVMLLPFVATDDQADGGTVRLPRIVGRGNALHMILTGAPVVAKEALSACVLSCVSDWQVHRW